MSNVATECHCNIMVGLRKVLHGDSTLLQRLPYCPNDKNSNKFFIEGNVPKTAQAAYVTVAALGRNGIRHDSHKMMAPERIRIRVFDTKDAVGLSLRILRCLKDVCICVGKESKSHNCCFKLADSRETQVGTATMSEQVFNTMWSVNHP